MVAAYDSSALLDETGRRILAELQADARISMAELGRRVALSPPSVAERVRRLEEAGIITGYHAAVDHERLGYGISAIVRLAPHLDERVTLRQLEDAITRRPEVIECHHTVGDDCFVLKVVARDTRHLEELLGELIRTGKTSTAIIMSSPLRDRPLNCP